MANEFFHGGFTYLFIKFLIISFTVWLICLPAMTSACISKDTLRNDTKVFLNFRKFIHEISLHLINFNFTSYFLPSSMQSSGAGTSNEIPLQKRGLALSAILITLPFSFFEISYSLDKTHLISFTKISSNISMASSDSDVFYMDQVSSEPSPQRNNSPNILNSAETSQTYAARLPSVLSIASPEPQIFTIDDDSNEPTMPYGFGRQLPIVPPSLNDRNLPPNPFNILNTMAVVTQTQDDNDEYSHLTHRPSQHHSWMSVHLTVGKHRKAQLTTTPSVRRTSHDVYTGPHSWMKPLISKTNPNEYNFCQVHHHCHLLARWRGR